MDFLQLVLHILGYDIWFYLSHRMLHTRWLWRFHKIHHEFVEPTWKETYHGHWFESVFQSMGFALPAVFGLYSILPAVLGILLVNARGMARHDRRLTWLIGNHHLIHHQNGAVNFGDYWIDCLFGTECREERRRCQSWVRL